MTHITGVPVKTRLPLMAWMLAGLITLFSTVSSLLHFVPASNQTQMLLGQATVQVRQASVNW
jgi:hypothetical protein